LSSAIEIVSLNLKSEPSQQGFTLPVWVAAAAQAALKALLGQGFEDVQTLTLPDRSSTVDVPVISAACLEQDQALAISRCDPGLGLDLTRDLEVWVKLSWSVSLSSSLSILAGEGIGTFGPGGSACLSAFARELIETNLLPLLPSDRSVVVQPVLPRGRELAKRTSNAAFGVVDGLALIGMQASVQRSAAPDQLQQVLEELRALSNDKAFQGNLVLVIGENGLDLARQKRLSPLLKVGNWLGPVLVAAAEAGVGNLLLLGYHGKLIKLAGGIFHTHHHLADGRLDVLTALAVDLGLPLPELQQLRKASSVDQAFQMLSLERAEQLGALLAQRVEQRSASYIARYGEWSIRIGAAVFDRNRALRWKGPVAEECFFTLKH